MPGVLHLPLVTLMMEEMLPNCRIDGVDYTNSEIMKEMDKIFKSPKAQNRIDSQQQSLDSKVLETFDLRTQSESKADNIKEAAKS